MLRYSINKFFVDILPPAASVEYGDGRGTLQDIW